MFLSWGCLGFGIGSFFLPQRELSNAWISRRENLKSSSNYFLKDKFSDEHKIFYKLYHDDTVGINNLFNEGYSAYGDYAVARNNYFDLSNSNKELLFGNIAAVFNINWSNINNKIVSDSKYAFEFIDKWIYSEKFEYTPNGSTFTSVFLILACFIPWSIYNFYFYNRFSGIAITVDKFMLRIKGKRPW